MKAVVFAGGAAARLARYIGGYNKHLMPLGKALVIEIAIRDLMLAGAKQFFVITNPGWEGDFCALLTHRLALSPSRLEVGASRSKHLPLTDVLLQAEEFVGRHSFLLYLGDNLFLPSPVPVLQSLLVPKVDNELVLALSDQPQDFGVVRFGQTGAAIARIDEKPALPVDEPAFQWVATGLARYTPEVFEIARSLRQTNDLRRSLSDLHNVLIARNRLRFLRWPGAWFDIGTYRRYRRCLDGLWSLAGQLHFDLAECPRPELLRDTLLAERINQLNWELKHGRVN